MDVLSPGLLGRLSVILIGLISFLWAFRREEKWMRFSSKTFNTYAWYYWAITRLGIFAAFYFLLGWEVSGDVAGYYFPQGEKILAGQEIYQDFESSYAPFFPYAIAGLLLLAKTPVIIVLFAIIVEAGVLFGWQKIEKYLSDKNTWRWGTILYLTCPLVLLNVAVNGQNQIWIAFFMVLSIWLILQKKDFWSGMAFSGALIMVKFLALLFVPAVFFLSRKRIHWTIGYAILPLLVYGYLLIGGVDILVPFKAESVLTSAGNIPYLVTSFLGLRNGLLVESNLIQLFFYGLLLLFLLALVGHFFIRKNPVRINQFPFVATLFLASFLLLSNKSQTSYLVILWFPVALAMAKEGVTRMKVAAWLVLSVVTILEPALWYRSQFLSLDIIWMNGVTTSARIKGIIMLCFDFSLILTYLFMIKYSWQKLNPSIKKVMIKQTVLTQSSRGFR